MFNVARLEDGRVFVLPVRKNKCRLRFKAEFLCTCISYTAAFYYACGLLRGENGGTYFSPYVKAGRAKIWKDAGVEV